MASITDIGNFDGRYVIKPKAGALSPTPRTDIPRLCNEVDFEPLGNWSLIQEIDAGIDTGRIFIPEAYGQTFRKGIVVCTGEGTVYSSGSFIKCALKVGDIVLYGKAAGLDVTIKEGAFKLVRESECFGKIPRKGNETGEDKEPQAG